MLGTKPRVMQIDVQQMLCRSDLSLLPSCWVCFSTYRAVLCDQAIFILLLRFRNLLYLIF